jgi:hypothetical protein
MESLEFQRSLPNFGDIAFLFKTFHMQQVKQKNKWPKIKNLDGLLCGVCGQNWLMNEIAKTGRTQDA